MGTSPTVLAIVLLEVTLQHALQSDAVASLVAGHLVDGVVDGIQAVLLGADGQVELERVRWPIQAAHLARRSFCPATADIGVIHMWHF